MCGPRHINTTPAVGGLRRAPPVPRLGIALDRWVTDVKPLRRLCEDESGVASTVGTIMALLVFLTFLSLIVNQYVPVWMKDTEASHMSGAFGQLGTFKGSVDVLTRYYIPQSVVYENGAVIRSQSDGQAVRADPTFEVDVVNNSVQVSWTHVSLFGQGSASGTTTEGIHPKLR